MEITTNIVNNLQYKMDYFFSEKHAVFAKY